MNKRSKLLIIISGIIIALAAVASFLVPELTKSDTLRIAESISSLYNDSIVSKIELDDVLEPKEALAVYLDSDDKDIDKYSIVVLKYLNNASAKASAEAIEEVYNYKIEKSKNNSIQLVDKYNKLTKKVTTIVKGKYLLIIYINSDIDEITSKFNEITKKINISDENNPNQKQIDEDKKELVELLNKEFDIELEKNTKKNNDKILEYINELNSCLGVNCNRFLKAAAEYENYDDLRESVAKVKEKYNSVMQEKKSIATSISNRISKLNTSLSQTEFDSIKKEINKLTSDSYYDSYTKGWNTSLNNIEVKIFKKSSVSLNYKNVLRNPSTYEGKKVYWFGEVVQVVDKGEYRVNVNCTKYQYIGGYSCSDTIYVEYSGSKNLIEDDMIKIWGTMDGTITYTSVMGASITIPSVQAKYIDIVG